MKKMVFMVTLLFFFGCASSSTNLFWGDPEDLTKSEFKPFDNEVYPPFQGEVRVLKKIPPGAFIIGKVHVTDETGEWEELVADMKERAARQGADAIVITKRNEERKEKGESASVGEVTMPSYRVYYEKHLEAVALIMKKE